MSDQKSKLVLLPNFLHPDGSDSLRLFPSCLADIMATLDGVICESEKEARLLLKHFSFKNGLTFRDIPLKLLNEHTESKETIHELLGLIKNGQVWGVVSDAGMPCLADPGSLLVEGAHLMGITVEAYMGPTSIILALLLSGFSAQSFSFHGYLPREGDDLKQRLVELKQISQKYRQTQLFIEAPYRNDKMLDALLEVLDPHFKIAIALDLGGNNEQVIVKSVATLKKERSLLSIHKRPAVFLFFPG